MKIAEKHFFLFEAKTKKKIFYLHSSSHSNQTYIKLIFVMTKAAIITEVSFMIIVLHFQIPKSKAILHPPWHYKYNPRFHCTTFKLSKG